MDYEDQEEEQEGEVGYTSNDSLPNPARGPTKLPSPVGAAGPPPRKARYKECLKNHAVGIGAHAVDGCGEFLPAGDDGTLESLKCAACGCHRNFHRRETDPAGSGAGAGAFPFMGQQQPHHHLLLAHQYPHGHFGYRGPGGYLGPPQRAAPVALALPSSSGGGGPSRDEMEGYYSGPGSGGGSGKKRFRTKFTAEQKDRMLSLAERLDWKIQKQDEELVQQFCSEAGIKRHVLKVWMHNNKHTLARVMADPEEEENLLPRDIRDILSTARDYMLIGVFHAYREANRAAHCLTQFARNSNRSLCWTDSFPRWLRDIVENDVS